MLDEELDDADEPDPFELESFELESFEDPDELDSAEELLGSLLLPAPDESEELLDDEPLVELLARLSVR